MAIKSDFPIFNQKIRGNSIVYLDSAASAQKPELVINAISDFYKTSYENVHRGMNSLSINATDLYERSRGVCAAFINSSNTNSIIFTRGATDSINLIANSIAEQLEEGDEIITTEVEHHSNFLPWMNICKNHKLNLKVIPATENGLIDENDVIQTCTSKTKIIAITHMSNVTGQIIDIKKIKESVDKNILLAVDGCQAIAHLQVDVSKINCDFYSFSSHKLYGPSGIGILYGKEELLNKLNPTILGGGMINQVSVNDFSYAMLPNKFEAGTPSIEAAIGFNAALNYLNQINFEKTFLEEKKLRQTLIEKMSNIDGVEMYGVDKKIKASSIISFNVKNKNFNDIATFLDQYGIMIRGGHHCCQPLMKKLNIPGSCRLSLGIYNDMEDISKFIDSLKKTINLLS
jgi:cysteine desulfurase/selenocysteine lyase